MPLFLIGREALEHPKIRTHRLNVTNPGGKTPRECHNPPMTHAAPASDEQEFWLFIQDAPLPAAEELQKNMFRLDACFRLNLSGAPERFSRKQASRRNMFFCNSSAAGRGAS